MTSEGTLVKVDLSYNLHAPTSTGKTAREIKPSFGFVLQVAKDYLMDLNRYGDVDRERVAMLMKAAEKSSRAAPHRIDFGRPDSSSRLCSALYLSNLESREAGQCCCGCQPGNISTGIGYKPPLVYYIKLELVHQTMPRLSPCLVRSDQLTFLVPFSAASTELLFAWLSCQLWG